MSYVVDHQVHDGLGDQVSDGAVDDGQVRVHQVPDDLHLPLQLRVQTVDLPVPPRLLHLHLETQPGSTTHYIHTSTWRESYDQLHTTHTHTTHTHTTSTCTNMHHFQDVVCGVSVILSTLSDLSGVDRIIGTPVSISRDRNSPYLCPAGGGDTIIIIKY